MPIRALSPDFVTPLQALSAGRGNALSFEGAGVAPGGLAGAFNQLVDDARRRDVIAQDAVESFARNEDPGRIHETMVAVSKAEISLRTLASVRNKLIEAYHELLHVTT